MESKTFTLSLKRESLKNFYIIEIEGELPHGVPRHSNVYYINKTNLVPFTGRLIGLSLGMLATHYLDDNGSIRKIKKKNIKVGDYRGYKGYETLYLDSKAWLWRCTDWIVNKDYDTIEYMEFTGVAPPEHL